MPVDNESRLGAYRKPQGIEDRLFEINAWLRHATDNVGVPLQQPTGPVVFVVGTQRSGSTLLMQLLARHFSFVFPDNVVARFWRAPYIGVIVSRSLRAQFGQVAASQPYESDYGVTSALFDPHEFGYFWTTYFGFRNGHHLTASELERVDERRLLRDLALMEYFGGGLPLLFKVVALSFHGDFLAERIPTSVFIDIRRDPLYVAQSTLIGRVLRYGTRDAWWSLKPKEYPQLLRLDPLEQVVAQVYYSRKHIEEALAKVPSDRRVSVDYERLCANVPLELSRIGDFLASRDAHIGPGGNPPLTFSCANTVQLEPGEFGKLADVVARYFG